MKVKYQEIHCKHCKQFLAKMRFLQCAIESRFKLEAMFLCQSRSCRNKRTKEREERKEGTSKTGENWVTVTTGPKVVDENV